VELLDFALKEAAEIVSIFLTEARISARRNTSFLAKMASKAR
jgi:hypothetical protein